MVLRNLLQQQNSRFFSKTAIFFLTLVYFSDHSQESLSIQKLVCLTGWYLFPLSWDKDTYILTVFKSYVSICIYSEQAHAWEVSACAVQRSSYLHKCGCWMLAGNRHCTGSNRNQECSCIDGGNMEAECIHQCLSYQQREISSNEIMADHCCCLGSTKMIKLIGLD